MYRSHVLVCGGTGCTSSGSDRIVRALENNIKSVGLEDEVKVIRTGCFGLCALGPIMIVYPEGAFYSRVNVDDVPEIVEEHLLKGRVVKRLLYQETVQEDTIKSLDQTDFYKKQMRVALKNCGVIDPENINEYIAYDGYAALGKVLTEMIQKASAACGEKVWQMPADELFLEPMKTSTIADYRHTGGKGGGTIAAGLLIREFAEGRHFAHLDIAGPAFLESEFPGWETGATGYGVRLLYQTLRLLAE